MKKTLFTLAVFAASFLTASADDVALVTLQIGKDKKKPRQVALEFYEGDAPLTVENFKKLARKKFYNGLAIHRAFPGTLVQMGDPLTDGKDRTRVGTGGPGYTLAPEIRKKHVTGAVAAARLPDKINPSRVSNGSQFFVCLEPMPSYDGQYTVFGKVIWGLDVLEEISNLPVDSNDYPVQRVEIRSVKIVPREQLPPPPVAPVPGPAPAPGKKWWQFF
jgi:cyclophilin family peptidyl-prolyl cis-trans isomerase